MSTKRQHYIPRMILKNHSINNLIYQYDTIKKIQRQVNIKDICFVKNLYELKDNDGKIIEDTRNVVENHLAVNEQKWDSVIRKILNNEKLSRNDIDLMYSLIAMQILRTPEILDWTSKNIKEIDNNLNENTSTKYAILANLMINEKSTPYNSRLLKIYLFLKTKCFIIYKSKPTFILNSDKPVLCFSNNYISKCNDKNANFVFPISSNTCIALTNKRHKKLYKNISAFYTFILNRLIYKRNGRFLYCKESIENKIIF